jgi:gamma-glutamylcyclotransferase (GGCT)/AIG2-like uncharacterized protein YtfP
MSKDRMYFAYGSNLNFQDWRRHRPGLADPADVLEFVSKGYLPDCEIVFNVRSPGRKGGVLNIKRRVGQVVPGVMYRVKEGGWSALDKKEGAPGLYQRIDTSALTTDGWQSAVTTYLVPDDRCESFVPPAPGYLEAVRHAVGEEGYGFDDAMLCAAAQNEPPPLYIDGLFVYGTLMRNECRHTTLHQFGVKCILLADTPGRLFDLDAYPAMVPSRDPHSVVLGEFIRLRHVDHALQALDELEGFEGFGARHSLYRRALIWVGVGDGRTRPAWTYLWADPKSDAHPILSGDWRDGKREAFVQRLVAAYCGAEEESVGRRLAVSGPFPPVEGVDAEARRLLPLSQAILRGDVSERRLAQITGKWAVVPAD